MKPFRITATMELLAALAAIVAGFYFFSPPPPPAVAQFAEQRAWGGTSGGTANAITVTLANYALDVGVPVRFLAGTSNTSATTANINLTGVVAVKRLTQVGPADLVGGEIIAGDIITLVFDGTQYKLIGRRDFVGSTVDIRTVAVPAGYLAEDGSCVSRTATATAALFAAIGTTYGVCDGTANFQLPDSRGRLSLAQDAQGGAGAANRVTVAGSNCGAITQAVGCGAQNVSPSIAQLPVHTPAGTIGQITPAGTIGQITPAGTISGSITGQAGQVVIASPGNVNAAVEAGAFVGTTLGFSGSFSGTPFTPIFTGTPVTPILTGTPVTPIFTGTSIGSGTPIAMLPPVLTTIRAVKL